MSVPRPEDGGEGACQQWAELVQVDEGVSGTEQRLQEQKHKAQAENWLSRWRHIPSQNSENLKFELSLLDCYEGIFVKGG